MLTTTLPNIQLFVYYNIIPMSILFLLLGAHKLHPATQTHPVLPVLITDAITTGST